MSEQRWGVWVNGLRWWVKDGLPRSWQFKAEAEQQIADASGSYVSLEVRPYPGPGAEAKGEMLDPNERVDVPCLYGCACSKHYQPADPRYTLAQLTRALAETDPELVAVATRAAEGDPARLERCIAKAVERDECGARTRAEGIVERARGRLER